MEMTLTPPPDNFLDVYNLAELNVGDIFLLVQNSKEGKITELDARDAFRINSKGIVTEKLEEGVKVIFFFEKNSTIIKSTDGYICVKLRMDKIEFSFVR